MRGNVSCEPLDRSRNGRLQNGTFLSDREAFGNAGITYPVGCLFKIVVSHDEGEHRKLARLTLDVFLEL